MPEMAAPAARLDAPCLAVDLRVEAGDWPLESELRAIVCRVVDLAAARLRPEALGGSDLSLLFTDDAHIRVLNRRYRNIDRATNVLSFPAPVPTDAQFGALLGDIVVASETLRREAESRGLTIEAHLAHLILHGFLHILGYDHADEAEASAMERLETGILGDLGIADPYAGPC
jgi:probable rRNA maturation factor